MKNSKNKRATILAVILLGLLIVGYKVMFVKPTGDDAFLIDQNIAASERIEVILKQVEGINFDTSVLKDNKLNSLISIEIPTLSLPIGKRNPFSAISN